MKKTDYLLVRSVLRKKDNEKTELRTDVKRLNSRRPISGGSGGKKSSKSSTFQYSKFRKSRNGVSRSFSNKNNKDDVIPPPGEGIIRIIPLGGVEEIGKNMTAIEIGEDIIVIDAGMHFSNEDTPGWIM